MGIRGPLPLVIMDILQELNLEAGGHLIHFQWIPGHSGIYGNEEADRGAAALQGGGRTHLSAVMRPVSPAAAPRYSPTPFPRILMRDVDPDLSFTVSARFPFVSLIHRFRRGVALTSHFPHATGRSDIMLCNHCATLADTEHLLIDCAIYANARDLL